MQHGIFCSSEMRKSDFLGLCKTNHIASPCFPCPATSAPKTKAKHLKENLQKNTSKGKGNLNKEIIIIIFFTYGKDKVSILDISFSPSACNLYSQYVSDFCLHQEKYMWL